MPIEAIPFALLLLGLLSSVVTAPLQDSAAASLKSNINETYIPTNYQRFQKSCLGEDTKLENDCLAYTQMVSAMKKHFIGTNETETAFNLELSKALLKDDTDNFCNNLTETLKHLPSELENKALTPFQSTKNCVESCYIVQGEKEYTLKDSCRVLNFGYELLKKWDATYPNKINEQPQQQSDTVRASEKQTGILKNENPKITNVGNSTKNDAKTGAVASVVEDSSKNLAPSKADSSKSNVAMETKPEEKLDKQPAIAPPLVVGAPEEALDDGDSEQDGADDGADLFDNEQKVSKGDQDPEADESVGRSSAEVANENVNKVKPNDFQPVESEVVPEKAQPQDEFAGNPRTSDIVQGADPFYSQNDSNFFSYFLFAMFSCAILYVAYHNKSKLLALVVEGRRTSNGRGGFSKGRKHTAAYRKLDSNLEEAITSGSASAGHSSSQIIY